MICRCQDGTLVEENSELGVIVVMMRLMMLMMMLMTMMMIIMRMIMPMRRRRGMVMKSLYRKVVEEKSGLTVGFRASPLPSRKLSRVSESALCTLY